jgi:hypothetical protein
MGKVIVMLLVASFGAQAHGQGEPEDLLQGRAAFQVGSEDVANLDATTFGKGEGSGPKGTFTPVSGGQRQGSKKVFGGTFNLMAGEGKPIKEDMAIPGYWGGKGDGRVASGPKGVFTPISGMNKKGSAKVFGGTNKLMAGEGKPIQQGMAVPSFWDKKRSTLSKAYGAGRDPIPRVGLAPQRLQGSLPRVRVPFALADQLTSGDNIFAVVALGMVLSAGVFVALQSRQSRKPYLAGF